MSKSEQVLKMLTKIPKGKITTYGELARAAHSSPRAIGQIMRNNRHPEVYPCYKVVSSNGDIGGFGGCVRGKKINEKIMLLRKDGIRINDSKIDIKKYLHKFHK